MKIKQFIMIRKFVPVKESVTDICCVLEFMGMLVWIVFLEIVRPVIIMTSNTKCCKFYDERVKEKDKKSEIKRMTKFLMVFPANVWYLG